MARYHDVPDEIKITSEMIEPALASIMARLWAQAEYMCKEHGRGSMAHADALENLWYAMDRMTSLVGLCIDCHHAMQVVMNHHRQIYTAIKAELGFAPEYAPSYLFAEGKWIPFRRRAEQHKCEVCGGYKRYGEFRSPEWQCPDCKAEEKLELPDAG